MNKEELTLKLDVNGEEIEVTVEQIREAIKKEANKVYQNAKAAWIMPRGSNVKEEEQLEMELEEREKEEDLENEEVWSEEYKEQLAKEFRETIRLFRASGEVDFQKFCTKLEKKNEEK